MKLVTTLEDKPGFLHALPLFDLFALAIMLLLLVPTFLGQSGVSVEVPSSQFHMQRYGEPIIITIGPGDKEAYLYLGREPVKLNQLEERLNAMRTKEKKARSMVVLKTDVRTSVGLERKVSEIVLKSGFKLALLGQASSPK